MSINYTYSEAIHFLSSRINYEAFKDPASVAYKFTLEPIKKLDALIGHPHKNLKIIHVAGTKGKGSVCMLLEYYLRKLGFKTGLYTSPHLYSPNERVRINGQPLSDEQFAEMISLFCNASVAENNNQYSYFEIMTLAALLYFKKESVDFVILETGLGGRLDATNIVNPIVSVITRIDLDHTNLLGNTHVQIASEKAGIIKANTPVIALKQREDVNDVFIAFANKNKSKLIFTEPDLKKSEFKELNLAEIENISIVRSVLKQLESIHTDLFKQLNIETIKHIPLPGRYEIFTYNNKIIMLDVAHNKISYLRLIEKLHQLFPNQKMAIALNSSRDKDLSEVIPLIKSSFSEIFILPIVNQRLYEPSELQKMIGGGRIFTTFSEGMKLILEQSSSNIIVFTGSFYLVGEVGKYFNRKTIY